jgi:hypothetical protein
LKFVICIFALVGALAQLGCSQEKQHASEVSVPASDTAETAAQKVADEFAEMMSAPMEKTDAAPTAQQPPAPAPVAAAAAPSQPRPVVLAANQLPASASLTQQQDKTFVTQRAVNWCIPASIENFLRYVGIEDVTQEKIIVAYCRMYGEKSLGAWARGNPPASVKALSDEAILAAAKPDFFTNGNFNTFSRAAAAVANVKSRGYEFEFVPQTPQTRFMEKLKQAIVDDSPVLMAFQVGRRAYHIVMVIGYDERGVQVFDPANGKRGTVVFSKFSQTHDGLILRPLKRANKNS